MKMKCDEMKSDGEKRASIIFPIYFARRYNFSLVSMIITIIIISINTILVSFPTYQSLGLGFWGSHFA